MIINRTNYENYFLRYVDGDLSDAEQLMVDDFVAENTNLATELESLLQTKFVPDTTVVFANKEKLFKKENKERTVLFFTWQKIAVAAAFIGLVIMAWLLLPTKESVHPIVINSTIKNKVADLIPNKESKHPIAINSIEKNKFADLMPTKKSILSNSNKKQPINHYAVQFKRPVNNKKSTQKNNTSIAVLDDATIKTYDSRLTIKNNENTSPNKALNSAATDAIAVQDQSEKTATANKTLVASEQINIAVSNNTNESSTKMHRTVYKELDTETDNNSLYVGSIELNKDKLRGLFRKAASLLKRKSDEPTNNTLIVQNNTSFN
ncbi:MAG: hypothetical protein WCL56_01205 [Sediminibacterium sp.]|jgi:hypothetical protein